jgi:hypothetical protein
MDTILSCIVWILILYLIIIKTKNKQKNDTYDNNNYKVINTEENLGEYYKTRNFVMTQTELDFYLQLRKELNKKNIKYNIFPQINLESIIQTKYQNFQYRNKIKSKSIDFTITSEETCKIICCIELDDYSHNTNERIERDKFINELFADVNIKLLRIQVSSNYDLESIIKQIQEVG